MAALRLSWRTRKGDGRAIFGYKIAHILDVTPIVIFGAATVVTAVVLLHIIRHTKYLSTLKFPASVLC